MSIFFRKKNKEKTRDLFEKKAAYQFASVGEYANLIDFQFAEKALYGRVDRNYIPIIAKDYFLELKAIPSNGAGGVANLVALNFVVDAFENLKSQFLNKTRRGEIAKDQKFLSNLVAHAAYDDPKKAYDKHVQAYISAFEEVVKDRSIKFINFDQFVTRLLPFLEKTIRKNPFTFPAYVKSAYCSLMSTGLAIEIASDMDHADDEKKMLHFYNSVNWEFYLNTCNNLGFMVDRNCPWRIVADVASGQMLTFAEPYGITSTDQILNITYKKAHRGYFDTFKVILYNMYHKLKVKRYTSVVTVSGTDRMVTRRPVEYSYQQFLEDHDDAYFLNLYCKMRFTEEESDFTPSEQARMIDNIIELSNFNLIIAIDSFERILAKTFDYNGSLSYINSALMKARG